MKHLVLILSAVFFSASIFAQPAKPVNPVETDSTTGIAPAGTYFKNGKLALKKGHTATYSDGRKTVIAAKARSGGGGG